MKPDEEESEGIRLLKQSVAALAEHFDTVQIFVTRHEAGTDDGGTMNANWSAGNWFARKGQISEWLIKQEERTRHLERKAIKEEEESA